MSASAVCRPASGRDDERAGARGRCTGRSSRRSRSRRLRSVRRSRARCRSGACCGRSAGTTFRTRRATWSGCDDVPLQLAVSLDPADDRGVEAEAGVEQEPPSVRPAEPDARERAPRAATTGACSSPPPGREGRRACARRRSSSRPGAVRVRCRCPARPSAASLSVPSPASTATTSKPSLAAARASRVA